MSDNITMKRMIIFLITLAISLILLSSPVMAHKVTLFAWVEGDTVHTQSKFSSGRPVKGSVIVVFDKHGKQLLEGVTDENGEFSFTPPIKDELKITLKASMGHLAEWTLASEEFSGSSDASPSPDAEPEKSDAVPIQENMKPSFSIQTTLNREELQNIIDESLDKKLAPISRKLVEMQEKEPGISEILGGIGYIFGLVGVALYVANRKKGA